MITIKKYPNRRLYDTSKSQYINLESIKEMVMGHQEFVVVDSKSGDDLTKSILLQIISEQESNDQQALLTQTVLKQLIRFYGSDMQVFMRQYLEQSIAAFMEQQNSIQGMMSDLMQSSPVGVFNQFIEQNMSMWKSFASGGQNPFASSSNPSSNSKEDQDSAEKH
ncbi:polyhydroxyalkanoate synthesis repressor PhaR [Teredinibacter sp. KSP-S5-2]|uniref:polyhydroxyalkanoate synthesis repressor PhaR n=1 Tax=Teredinibacter sp. KSP-S5-2 TaxID=3034506 RepID=UPI002934E718|nr:polyhydroxyalkanoate synthesis repressor PhaR [Teredinibacter sp. KSP-S5-2]WNO07509.1 polyhydroxyalkanoate synthesis repressor PhaR [Teredinibacter sp. KSP-S5-2]